MKVIIILNKCGICYSTIKPKITPYKLYLALALKKNQKYCFGELGNTTGQHSTAQHSTPSFRLRLRLRLRLSSGQVC